MNKKQIIKWLDEAILAYGPCANADGKDGCDVCSARHAPVLAMKELRKRLKPKRRRNRASTTTREGR